MYSKVLTILFRNEDMRAVRASKFGCFRKAVIFSWREMSLTDFTTNLRLFLSVIPRKIENRSITSWAVTVLRNIAFDTAKHRFDFFAIASLVVGYKVIPVPILLEVIDSRKFINFKFLVLW